jgi:hypothetical protein
MRALDLITESNDLADETESNATVLAFLNQAIAKINTILNCGFPYLTLTEDSEPVFSVKWQRTLLIPFAVGRIKQKDASQFEYTDAYSEFMDSLDVFKQKYRMPIIYKCIEADQEIILNDAGDKYTAEEDDTYYSIALAEGLVASDLVNLNEDEDITFVDDDVESTMLDSPPLSWHGHF